MVRVLRVFLTIEREHHVIGVQFARRFEFFIVVPLHTFTQMEGIGFTVFADFPLFSEARDHFSGADFKFNQTVIKRYGRGVIGGAGGKQLRVKPFRRSF